MQSTPCLALSLVLVSLGPFLAFLYTFFTYLTYAINHETPWNSKGGALSLRLSLTAASVAIAMGICQAADNNNNVNDWWPYLVLGIAATISWASSGYYMLQTRRDDVVGIDKPPFYGVDYLKGKLFLVTGANNGIGKETTHQLAAMGATVVLLCRSVARAHQAANEILQRDPDLISKEQLVVIPLDLGDFASVHKAVDLVEKQFANTTVDVLINNAGLMMGTQTKSKDGLDLMMQANHLGHFLLTRLLLQKNMLRCNSSKNPSRVINLTSSTYEMTTPRGGFDFDDIMCDKGMRPYTLFGQYSQTKLANILFSKELTRRYKNLLVYAVHPGIVRTNVTSNMQWFWRIPNEIFGVFVAMMQKTPAEGAYSTIFVSTAPKLELPSNGTYILNCKAYPTLCIADSEVDAQRLWLVSDELVGLRDSNSGTRNL
jgi:NAD(P)-dependent dehydrogenase (short-subunit alcohol dehydrogenase family)